MNLAYVRVSTFEQNADRQELALKKYDIDKWFVEKVSAKDTNRTELQKLLEFAREGDCVYVHDFSRLARKTKDLLDIVDLLKGKGVHLISNKEKFDTSTPTGKLMLTMMGAIATFEREIMLERQREGIEAAKQRGVYKGRKEIHISDFSAWYERYRKREFNKRQLAENLNISRPTLDKLIKEEEKRLGVGITKLPK